jgi:hypothetical protein
MFTNFSKFVLFVVLCTSIALSGNISGKINFKGGKPAASKIKMASDQKCLKLHSGKDVVSDQVVVNGNNTLKWTFVYVKKGLEGKKFPQPKNKATIDQMVACTHLTFLG